MPGSDVEPKAIMMRGAFRRDPALFETERKTAALALFDRLGEAAHTPGYDAQFADGVLSINGILFNFIDGNIKHALSRPDAMQGIWKHARSTGFKVVLVVGVALAGCGCGSVVLNGPGGADTDASGNGTGGAQDGSGGQGSSTGGKGAGGNASSTGGSGADAADGAPDGSNGGCPIDVRMCCCDGDSLSYPQCDSASRQWKCEEGLTIGRCADLDVTCVKREDPRDN